MNDLSGCIRGKSSAGTVSKNLLTLIVSVIVSFALLEIGLRLFTHFPINFTSGQVEHPYLMYTMNPELEFIDENGFRNQATAPFDIVAIGDSHTYGWNVALNQAWPVIVGDRLGKKVYNMGMGGYDLLQYHYLLEQSLSMSPKIVLLGLYLPNDLEGMCELVDWNEFWRSWARSNDVDPGICPETEASSTIGVLLHTNLAIASMINLFLASKRGTQSFSGTRANALTLSTEKNVTNVRFDYIHGEFMDLKVPRIAVAYDILKKLLADFQAKAQAEGISFGVLMMPSKVRVMSGFAPALPPEISIKYSEAVINEDRLTKDLAQFMAVEGIAYRDLRPDMEVAVETIEDVYPSSFDDHPTVAGQQVYADGAYQLIIDHGWLTRESQASAPE